MKIRSWFFTLLLGSHAFAQTYTLRVSTYNILNYPGPTNVNPYLKLIYRAIEPDVVILQEFTSLAAANTFKKSVLDSVGRYSMADFVDGFDTDNCFFYNNTKLRLSSRRQIKTELRDISEYVLRSQSDAAWPPLYFYSLHLKANSDVSSEAQRGREAQVLRNELDKLPANANFILAGDFNVYTSAEAAIQILTATGKGQCLDPVDKLGDWHNNPLFSSYHTQSTRTAEINDGSSGGMDDRFDFIFCSPAMMDESEWHYVPGSYTAFGNDGNRFNRDINHPANQAVSATLANALYWASDHLPVYVDITYNKVSSLLAENRNIPHRFALGQNYPNPFNTQTTIPFQIQTRTRVRLSLFDVQGRLLKILAHSVYDPGEHKISANLSDLASGIYYYQLESSEHRDLKRLVLIK
jgi:endonuclease/exonuclease/phosphatase family metal-dependent hydrolase